jgi:hypothetical protein
VVEFRLYCLDRDGRIDLADVIHASTDEEAIAKARVLKRHTLKCEVWQGRRLVATLTADDLAA